MSKTMYELSVDVISSNNMSDKVTILHRKSNDIDVPKDIPEREIIIVSQTTHKSVKRFLCTNLFLDQLYDVYFQSKFGSD